MDGWMNKRRGGPRGVIGGWMDGRIGGRVGGGWADNEVMIKE